MEGTERKRKQRRKTRRKQRVSTSETAVGAKLGRTKGNKRKAEYLEVKRKYGKPDGRETEKAWKRKQKGSTGKAAARQEREEKGKEEQ